MPTVGTVSDFLQQRAPLSLAETWDSVGLLVGDRTQKATRIMTCLTLSGNVAAEAIRSNVQLVVAHHPLPFRPLPRLTTDQTASRIIWQLARANISVYSAHTAFDSAAQGINQQLAERLQLEQIEPLLAKAPTFIDNSGTGRCGVLRQETPAIELVKQVKTRLELPRLSFTGSPNLVVQRIAIACGSGGSLLPLAISAKCQALVTGDIGFHDALEAEANGMCVLAIGHYQSERFAMEALARELKVTFADCEVWASRDERDPFVWY